MSNSQTTTKTSQPSLSNLSSTRTPSNTWPATPEPRAPPGPDNAREPFPGPNSPTRHTEQECPPQSGRGKECSRTHEPVNPTTAPCAGTKLRCLPQRHSQG